MEENPLCAVSQRHATMLDIGMALAEETQSDKVFNLVDPSTGTMQACAIIIDDTADRNTTSEVAS